MNISNCARQVACLALLAVALPAAAERQVVEIPAAAGSLGPNLSTGPDGLVLLSWLEPQGDDHALRFARWTGERWSDPGTVASGGNWFVNWADFPSVVAIRDDFWTAHWLVRRPAGGYAYDVYVARSTDAGRTWSEAEPPHHDDTDTEHGFVSTYTRDGGAGLVWLDGRRTSEGRGLDGDRPSGMTLRSATLTPSGDLLDEREIDNLICDCCQTDVTVTADGPVAVYRDRTAKEVRDIYVARHIDGEWQPGTAVNEDGWEIPGCPVNGPVVASRGREVVVAWFTAADNDPRVRLARSAGPAAAFTPPVDVIEDAAVGRVGLALLPDGGAAVSALRSSGPGKAALTLTRVDRDGRMHAPVTIADGLSAFNVPQIVALEDELLLVWTARTDGKHRLYSERVPLTAL